MQVSLFYNSIRVVFSNFEDAISYLVINNIKTFSLKVGVR